jgi:hypothetical protein
MLGIEPDQFRLWAAVFAIFLIGILVVTYGVRRQTLRTILNNILPRWLLVAVIVAIEIAVLVFRFAFETMVNFLRNLLLDIATFPSSLVVRRRRYSEKDEDDGDLCRLILGCFPTLVDCPRSLESPADVDLFSCDDEPPSQLGPFVEALELPENVWFRERFEGCVWKRFHELVRYPWLWFHMKYLACILVGIILIAHYVLFYAFHPRELLAVSLESVLQSALKGCLSWLLSQRPIQHYWLHVYHRSTQRVCDRWAESFRRRGLLVDFCIRHEHRVGWAYYLLPKEKSYVRFRRVQH